MNGLLALRWDRFKNGTQGPDLHAFYKKVFVPQNLNAQSIVSRRIHFRCDKLPLIGIGFDDGVIHIDMKLQGPIQVDKPLLYASMSLPSVRHLWQLFESILFPSQIQKSKPRDCVCIG